MPRVCFSCTNAGGAVLDRRTTDVKDLTEARQHATALVQLLIPAVADWRRCRLRAQDERGADLFVMPFWSALRKPGLRTRIRTAFARALS